MPTYTRKPNAVEAFQYDRQPKAEWPQWLQDYQVATPMGFQGVGAGAGMLLVPTKNGPTINVTVGEWVVYENGVKDADGKLTNGVLLVFRDDLFRAAFDIEGADETAAVEAPAAEAPAAETPVEVPAAEAAATPPVADAKADKKKPAGSKPAEDAPAAE